jgi:hypothetical protein
MGIALLAMDSIMGFGARTGWKIYYNICPETSYFVVYLTGGFTTRDL